MYEALYCQRKTLIKNSSERPLTNFCIVTVHLKRIRAFAFMNLFSGEYRSRSACTYVQSDLALHSPLFFCQ